MSNYEEAVERLLEVIKKHDSVIEFQKAEERVKDFPELGRIGQRYEGLSAGGCAFSQD